MHLFPGFNMIDLEDMIHEGEQEEEHEEED